MEKQLHGRILNNSIMNLAGAAIPALVSLFTIPYVVKQLGHDSYGVFTLVTAIIGYFALLDINFTSGSVKFLAEYNARGERSQLREVISFGAIIYVLVGAAAGLLIYLLAEVLVRNVFVISPEITPLAIRTLQIAALGFFFGNLRIYIGSILQSLQRFDMSASVEMCFGTAVPLVTVALLWLGYGLVEVVAWRVVASMCNVLLLLFLVYRLIPDFDWVKPSPPIMCRVTSFSAYAYLSRVAALTYAHADKLIIGTLGTMAELTFYTVPTTLVNRILGLTFRLGSVLYPVASELHALHDHGTLGRLYLLATRYLTYLNTFFVMMICLFSYPILYWWIGEEFAQKGQWIMVVMAVAMLIDSLTNLPSLVNDGLGYPSRTGMFAVIRAAGGLGLMLFLTRPLGIMGAATANLIASTLIGPVFLVYVHRKTIPVSLRQVVQYGYVPSFLTAGGICFVSFLLLSTPEVLSLPLCVLFAAIVTIVYLAAGLLFIVEDDHRRRMVQSSLRLLGHAA